LRAVPNFLVGDAGVADGAVRPVASFLMTAETALTHLVVADANTVTAIRHRRLNRNGARC